MNIRRLGRLDHGDPLHPYLRDHVLPQFGAWRADATFRVFQSDCSRDVYLYEEVHHGPRVVCKFYPPKPGRPAWPSPGETEYRNLAHLRSLGFDAAPHYVVRPLGFEHSLGNVLVMEWLHGDTLCRVIEDAMHQGRRGRLHRKLTALAWFLASQHNRTAGDWYVDFDHAHVYMGRLVDSLIHKRGMGQDHSHELWRLREEWRRRDVMREDRAVLCHGDATPSNFLFGQGRDVLAIDLERMLWADRAFDLGRLCGELAHFFHRGQGDPALAEPFIGHFLWEYCCHFPDRHAAFHAITRRIPFYMGITLLRIARNSWIDPDYRWRLVRHAQTILGALP
ncbi:hypothetical protein NNJEOMEG_03151 [Fundidesulfovibrio magnetotacticus]|uniref:Aminoglycoside phosphotransferase domain-containing protein n=1 Tax=Fundidesulfovibrio magnetotacticus TaxID=2730080 RepID=A0A6V8LS44_9BACT|nr:aminoglycoside phosphotransferase family protein [Fundidesulfovibrio magnetotacticus]GFK95292.1 hypothetical protein NNJEOMEG_03151 [Fundidesulfovibrio magnetotacticus]